MFCGPLCWCISALLKGVLGDYCTKPVNKPASHSTARLSCQLNLASGTFWNTPPQGSAVWGCVPVSLSGNPGAQMFGYHSCSIPRPGEQLPHPRACGAGLGEASVAAGSISVPTLLGRSCCHSCPQLSLSSCFWVCRQQNQGPLRAPLSRQLGKGSFGFSRCQRLLFVSTALI